MNREIECMKMMLENFILLGTPEGSPKRAVEGFRERTLCELGLLLGTELGLWLGTELGFELGSLLGDELGL
jgi:hypothetical protein